MTTPTTEQISKLPKWARDHIESLKRELNATIATVRRFDDAQTESPIYCDDWRSNPRMKRFIPCPDRRIMADWAGVHVELFLPSENDNQRPFGPEITYKTIGSGFDANISLSPRAIGQIALLSKENMR